MLIDRRTLSHFDWGLLSAIYFVCVAGLIVLYSAGYEPDRTYLQTSWFGDGIHSLAFLKQALFWAVGTLVLICGVCIPVNTLHRYAFVWFGLCIVLLVSVLFIGTVFNGSRRWIDFGPIHLQPAELAKLGVILALAKYMSRYPPPAGGYRLKDLMIPLLMIVVPMALIIRQPDLGTSLAVGAAGAMMVLFMGVRFPTILIGLAIVVVTAFPAWNLLHDYQKRRILTLVDPESDPLGSGYHLIQSKIAVGSGAFLGKGFLRGTQSQLEFLPEHTTDFVFSVLAEEWGFIGCLLVLVIYGYLLFRILRVVQRSKDLFGALVVIGIGSLLFFHVIVNIGMVIGILPVVGIPLPLFSYGGSALFSFLFSLGLVLGISARRWILIRSQ